MFRKNKNPPNLRRAPNTQPGQRAFSYYANRPQDNSNRLSASQPARQSVDWKLLPSMIALLAILLSLGYASLLDTNPRINKGSHKTAAVLQTDETYQMAVQKLLQESIFSRSKVLIDTSELEKKILEQFPEIKTASITIPLTSRRPIVAIEPVEPAILLRSNTQTYLIENTGRAIRELAGLNDFTELPLITDQSGLSVKVGKQVLPTSEVTFLRELNHQLSANGLKTDSITLPAIPNQADVRLSGEPYYIKFNLQGDARLQFGALNSVKQRLEAQKTKPAEYIDVRVEDKAFYK